MPILAGTNSLSSGSYGFLSIVGAVSDVASAIHPALCFLVNALSYAWVRWRIFKIKLREAGGRRTPVFLHSKRDSRKLPITKSPGHTYEYENFRKKDTLKDYEHFYTLNERG
jgi:hypothetical protein